MPYTPPSHRSPASSDPASPGVSRRSFFQASPRPSLPHSDSYLNKHRRTTSTTTADDEASFEPRVGLNSANGILGGSLRQSPPLPLDERELIPKGAIVLPSDSVMSSSDDDDTPEIRGRNLEALKDMHDAMSQMPLPVTPPAADKSIEALQQGSASPGMRACFSTGSLVQPSPEVASLAMFDRQMSRL